MKIKFLMLVLVVLAVGAGAVVVMKPGGGTAVTTPEQAVPAAPAHDAAAHANSGKKPRVPAYQTPSDLGDLPPTLAASDFFGKTRQAYEVAKKIPETLAQLPCYCECDRGFGHKSLHTCFVDDHASHCAVCVDEALLAYRLQTDEKLTPEQVREKIIEQYGAEHQH
jgi:hypothetical protein